jgi:class 3 adenylate cyclase
VGDIAYAQSGETQIAYRVIGDAGRVDVVVVAGALFPFELLAEDRVASRFTTGLAALGRVAVFDKRGVGLSDPITDWSRSLQEQWAEDLLAVIAAAGLDHPVVVSWEPNGVGRRAASGRRDLFRAMVLVNPAWSTRSLLGLLHAKSGRALPNRTIEELAFPSRINDEEFTAWLERSGRSGASPSAAARTWEHLLSYEGTLTPPGITAPTLVLHNRDCRQPEAEVRAVAEEIAGAAFVQVAGVDVYPVAGDVDVLISEIAEFVTGGPSGLTPLRHISAVLFTDLVNSTPRAVEEGDAQWRDLLDVHDRTVEQCVRHHGGRVVKYTGDGVLALMPSATAALEAASSIRDRLAGHGLRIRAGIHVGDVDVRGDDVSGLAVNIAARIMSHADADETLVSEAARQATLGSRHRFASTRTTRLKGLPGHWTLHRHIV